MDTISEFTKTYLRNSLGTKEEKIINHVYVQIKSTERKIAWLQKQLIEENDMEVFEELRRKIDRLEIKRYLMANPVAKDEKIEEFNTLHI